MARLRELVTSSTLLIMIASAAIRQGVALSSVSEAAQSQLTKQIHSPQITADVVRYLKSHTTLQLVAPTYVPMQSQMDPQPYSYVGASVQVTKKSYEVGLTYVDQRFPVNSPQLNSTKYNGLAHLLGGFGATRYSSDALATQAVKKVLWKTSGRVTRRYLGHGITAETMNMSTPYTILGPGIVMWHEGGWTFQVTDGPLKYDIKTAKQLVSYLAVHPIHQGHGSFLIDNAGDGEHTEAMWTKGRMAINCGNYHDAQDAIRMVESMKSFRP